MNFLRLGLLAVAALSVPEISARDLSRGRWIDLTHAFNDRSIYWPTAEPFKKTTVTHGHTPGGWFYSAYNFSAAEHGGTHIDAPIHFAEDGRTVDQLPVSQLIGPGFVIDVSRQATADVDYLVSVADFEAFEAQHGQLPEGAIVLLKTGRAKLYSNPGAYARCREPRRYACENTCRGCAQNAEALCARACAGRLGWTKRLRYGRPACAPLLALAEDVEIFTVRNGSEGTDPAEAAEYLSRHGVHATIRTVEDRLAPPDALIHLEARDWRADYVVMGAYNHGRLREFFGGVTKRLLGSSQLPLVLAH